MVKKVGVIATAIAGLLPLAGCASSDVGSTDSFGARDTCEKWVKDQLKAPAAADFSGEQVEGGDHGPWSITGAVDAENSFGAKLRTRWTCDVRLEGDYYKGNATLTD